MIRLIIENVLLFLLPTLLYVVYRAATRVDDRRGVLDDAPIAWLMLAGAAMVVVVLIVFASKSTGGRPDQRYVPPTVKDGKVVPGGFE